MLHRYSAGHFLSRAAVEVVRYGRLPQYPHESEEDIHNQLVRTVPRAGWAARVIVASSSAPVPLRGWARARPHRWPSHSSNSPAGFLARKPLDVMCGGPGQSAIGGNGLGLLSPRRRRHQLRLTPYPAPSATEIASKTSDLNHAVLGQARICEPCPVAGVPPQGVGSFTPVDPRIGGAALLPSPWLSAVRPRVRRSKVLRCSRPKRSAGR